MLRSRCEVVRLLRRNSERIPATSHKSLGYTFRTWQYAHNNLEALIFCLESTFLPQNIAWNYFTIRLQGIGSLPSLFCCFTCTPWAKMESIRPTRYNKILIRNCILLIKWQRVTLNDHQGHVYCNYSACYFKCSIATEWPLKVTCHYVDWFSQKA